MEVYLLSNHNAFLAEIDSTDSIRNALDIFKQKTGLIIDEYGDTRLHLNHVTLLEKHTEDSSPWKKVFQKAIEKESGLFIVGD